MTLQEVKDMKLDLEDIKELIDDWFDDDTEDGGREDLEDLAEFITSNLNDI